MQDDPVASECCLWKMFCGTVSSRPPLRNGWNGCSKIFHEKFYGEGRGTDTG